MSGATAWKPASASAFSCQRHEYQDFGKAVAHQDERAGSRLGEMDANAVRLDYPVCDLRH